MKNSLLSRKGKTLFTLVGIKLGIVLACFASQYALADDVLATLRIKEWPHLEELPVQAENHFFQDSEGYLWFGTIDGLCRFDGYELDMFRSTEYPELQSNTVTQIEEDQKHHLWLRSLNGLYLLDKQDYSIHSIKNVETEGQKAKYIHITADGSIYISVKGKILRYDSDGRLRKVYRMLKPSDCASYMCEDFNGYLLLGVHRHGISRLNPRTGKIEYNVQPVNMSNCIVKDTLHHCFWVGTWGNGIMRYDPSAVPNKRLIAQPLPINSYGKTSQHVISCALDNLRQFFWVITFNNMFAFRIKSDGMLEQVNMEGILPAGNKIFYKILRDNVGNLWLSALDRKSFVITANRDDIAFNPLSLFKHELAVSPMVSAWCHDGEYSWANIERCGLCLYNEQKGELTCFTDCPQTATLPLRMTKLITKAAQKDKIWALPDHSSFIYGLRRVGTTIKLDDNINVKEVMGDNSTAQTIFDDGRGTLWIGTSNGVVCYDTSTKRLRKAIATRQAVTGFTMTPDGSVWACCRNMGLLLFSKYEKRTLLYKAKRNFTCIVCQDNVLWIGTEDGKIYQFDVRRRCAYRDFSRSFGVDGRCISNILSDNNGNVWAVTNHGLCVFNPTNRVSRTYSVFSSIPMERLFPQAVSIINGTEIKIGGVSGLVSIKSPQLSKKPSNVRVIITGIKVGERSVYRGSLSNTPINLTTGSKNISISFSSLDYLHASDIRYAYRMKGVDNGWVYTSPGENKAFYNRLPKGNLTFQVKAMDADGYWSDQTTELTVHRQAAWFETTVAHVFFFLLVTCLITAVIYAYINRLRRKDETELVRRMTEIKLRYFTNVSHDLLTPLTTTTCIIDEMERAGGTDHGLLTMMRANVGRLRRLILQVLDFRQTENGEMKLAVNQGDLAAFIRNTGIESFSAMSIKQGINFTFEAQPESITGYFDHDKVDRVVFNLYSNAFKYTPAGGHVKVSLTSTEADGHTFVVFSVADSGVGISKKELPLIFNRFYNNTSAEAGVSHGVGLSVTKELVKLHHGTISVSSQQGLGTTFTVTLPIDRASYSDEEIATTASETKPQPVIESGREVVETTIGVPAADAKNLLLVEDNNDLLTVMKRLFCHSYQVYTASDGVEALRILNGNDIDIMVSDVMMPNMDGYELCRHVRADINISHVIIVLLTAKTMPEDQIDSYKAGADAYVAKPFRLDVLLTQMKTLLSNRERRQQNFRSGTSLNITPLDIPDLDTRLLEKALKCVEKNLSDETFDVETLSHEVGMSRSSLMRKLKMTVGLTPLEFIKSIKMKHACNLLTETNLTINEIIQRVGYSDMRYFSRMFQAEYGVSPTEYRKEEKAKGEF